MSATQHFADAARAYVAWAECPTVHGELREAFTARRLLARLIAGVVELPRERADSEAPDIPAEDQRRVFERFGRLPFNYYSECFDPLVVPAEEPVVADLADDLADVWRDVKAGLLRYDAGDEAGAAWHWTLHFSAHWGLHATAALYALQCWISKEGDDRTW